MERSSLVVGVFEVAGMTICLLLIAPRNSIYAKTDTNQPKIWQSNKKCKPHFRQNHCQWGASCINIEMFVLATCLQHIYHDLFHAIAIPPWSLNLVIRCLSQTFLGKVYMHCRGRVMITSKVRAWYIPHICRERTTGDNEGRGQRVSTIR